MSEREASADHELARALPSIEARLRHQFPTVPAELVRGCIDDAVQATAGAIVRNFLLILIERQASDALRDLVQAEPAWAVQGERRRPPSTQNINRHASAFEDTAK